MYGCDQTSDIEPHVDADDSRECDYCYYSMPCEHDYTGAEYHSDDTGHWQSCTKNCGTSSGKEPHADNDDDGRCDTCNYVTCTHDNMTYSYDAENHFLRCYGCNKRGEEAPHVYNVVETMISHHHRMKCGTCGRLADEWGDCADSDGDSYCDDCGQCVGEHEFTDADGDNICDICGAGGAQAENGEIFCELEQALGLGGTVKLLANHTETWEDAYAMANLYAGVEVTLDLNGFTLSAEGADYLFDVYKDNTLKIIDSSAAKSGTMTNPNGSGIISLYGGVVDLREYPDPTGLTVYNDTNAPVAISGHTADETPVKLLLPEGCVVAHELSSGSTLIPARYMATVKTVTTNDVQIVQSSGGTVEVSNDAPAAGDTVTITVTPDSGKEIDQVTVKDENGNHIKVTDKGNGTYTFTQPAGDVTVEVVFAEAESDSFDRDYWLWMLMMLYNQQFDITAAATDGGTITPDGVTKVKYSNDLTYTITPDDGYAIADILVDGESVGAVSVYTFDNVRKDHEIKAIFAEIPWENPYSDVSESDWFYEDVQFVDENNLMNGTVENEIFAPDMTATRAMIVTILWRLEGEPVVNYLMQFEDVPQDEWYSEAVRWAAANGIVLGYDDGLFRPEKAITREQLAAILHRYAAYKGVDNGVIFPMLPQCDYSLWAENDVIWAEAYGLLDGIGNDMTDMTADASRAEVAAMLRRFCEISG